MFRRWPSLTFRARALRARLRSRHAGERPLCGSRGATSASNASGDGDWRRALACPDPRKVRRGGCRAYRASSMVTSGPFPRRGWRWAGRPGGSSRTRRLCWSRRAKTGRNDPRTARRSDPRRAYRWAPHPEIPNRRWAPRLTFSPPAADHEPLTTPDHDDVPSTDSRRRGAPVATCNARGPASATSGARATAWIPWRGPQTRESHPTS